MGMDIRTYDNERDLEAVRRAWDEVGWLTTDRAADGLEAFAGMGHGYVGMIDGAAECFVHWTPGSVRYEHADLELAAVTAVTTSRIARRQGLATQITAEALADAAAGGAVVAMLGMFDQGFYNRVGFGTGTYEHHWTFDPHALTVDVPYRRPSRLDPERDWEAIHGCIAGRMREHGGVVLRPPQIMKAEMAFVERPFALGYRDGDEITHCLVGSARGESGPYEVAFVGYRTTDQLMELLRLVRELGDQVVSVTMVEPPGIQLQDLLERPYRDRTRTRRSEHETVNKAFAWWQLRLLDIPASVAARHWGGIPVAFQLRVADPLETRLDGPWKGVGGDYVVEIGAESSARRGSDAGLPLLEASIGAFSRMWFGVRPATGLAVTDRLAGPSELLARLDEALALPPPLTGLAF